MTLFLSHPVLMIVYALAASSFLAVLWRERGRERWKLFFLILTGLLAGGYGAALIMEYAGR